MSYNYGLSTKDLDQAKAKLEKQKNFLESQTFLAGEDGEIKTLLDYSYSANLSKRYYPRILNKVDTFVSINLARNYTPIFLTVTLDGFFRDFLKGDFTRFKGDVKEKYIKGNHIPNNDRSGYYLDHIESEGSITPKDLYKILGHQLTNFIKSNSLQSIRKKGDDYSFIRVTEPHKDGVPHFHILMYVPEQYVLDVYKEFTKFFPAPRNHKEVNYKDNKRKACEILQGSGVMETQGFQTEIRSPVGYILKYILKSFRNMIKGEELDYLQAWYVHNKIPRIITTHTLISQDVYHHASLLDDDWFYLTDIKRNGTFKRDAIMNTFHLISVTGRELLYENGYYKLINSGYTIKEFGVNKIYKMKFTQYNPKRVLPKFEKYEKCILHKINLVFWKFVPKSKRYVYKIEDRENFIEVQFEEYDQVNLYIDKTTGEIGLKRDFVPVTKLTGLELYNWYHDFDFDKYHIKKYGLIRRELIERGLLDESDISLNEFGGY